MEDIFKAIQVDKTELAKVKTLLRQKLQQREEKKARKRPKKGGEKSTKEERDDYIPFDLSDEDEPAVVGEKPADKVEDKPNKPVEAPRAKRLRIDSLLHKGMPWLAKAPLPTRSLGSMATAQRLHLEIVEFINWMSPTEEERYARQDCIERVRKAIRSWLPSDLVKLQVFGSVSTQFYVPSSDIDLVLLFDEDGLRRSGVKVPRLKKVAQALTAAGIPEEGSIKIIQKARVPIIKYTDARFGYPIDIAFNATSGTESADLIAKEGQRYPALRPLTLLLKQFLEMRGLNEVYTGGLGSYAVTCFVLSFLQIHPLVQAGLVRPHENLAVMLMEMFELYGRHFNYEVVGMAVASGGSYYDKGAVGRLLDARPGAPSVEDPQNPDNDITKGSFGFHQVRQAFEHGFDVLQAAISEYDRLVTGRNPGSIKDAASLSILGSIIRIDDAVLRHRYYVEQTANI